jgi:cobalt-zinc-cadmium efflux system membrane fusion protein
MKKNIIGACALLALLAACKDKTPDTQATLKKEACVLTPELKKLIELKTIGMQPISQELELTGSVSYDQDHIFSYQSLASGVVQQVFFKLGDYVHKGQVLAEMRTAELNSQKSELVKAEADLKLAQRKLKAAQSLYEDGVASEKDLQEARNDAASAQAELTRINETLKLQGGQVEKGLLQIKAPADGYVVEKKITEGMQIDASQDDLFVISNLKKIWVMANVYAAQLEKVKVGQEVNIMTTAYPDKIFSGKVSRLSNVFDAEERVLKAIIELDNADLLLKPSMMVQVNIENPVAGSAIAIPKDAVLFTDNAYHVVAYNSDCDVRIADITPIAGNRKWYYVDSTAAIKSGAQIISKNHLLIYTKLKEQ